MMTFDADGREATGYLAMPPQGHGSGVLVLHAWWGLNQVFKDVCDHLAAAGFVAFAPDLYAGKLATTVEEAEAQMKQRDDAAMEAIANGGLAYLRAHPAVRGDAVGAIGFSMGANWASALSAQHPDVVAAVVLFYGAADANFTLARAAYQGHFAENDEWEPLEYVQQMEAAMRAAGRDVTLYTYPDVQHWFVETDRPEYNQDAATLAWQRTVDFLGQHLNKA